jgi:hypothetical protein
LSAWVVGNREGPITSQSLPANQLHVELGRVELLQARVGLYVYVPRT